VFGLSRPVYQPSGAAPVSFAVDGDAAAGARARSLVEVLVVDPAPAVRGDLVAELDAGVHEIRMALHRHRPRRTPSAAGRAARTRRRMRQPPTREPYS
jgi:hypothetical protein